MLNYRWDYESNLLYQQEQQEHAELARLARLARLSQRRRQTRSLQLKNRWQQVRFWRKRDVHIEQKSSAHRKRAYS